MAVESGKKLQKGQKNIDNRQPKCTWKLTKSVGKLEAAQGKKLFILQR